ncbi:MAG: hypothetical protein GXP22_03150 [Gammaproteobacteria bacterium]|nr:hypothetical protein [Gammaproteobacteria bacterium]
MLQVIRDRVTGWFAWVIVGLISAIFVLGGVSSYLDDDASFYAAQVNDVDISIYEYQRSYQQQKQRMRQLMGARATPALLESKAFKAQVLNRLVDDEILVQAAMKMGFSVGDQLLAVHIQRIPDFQEDGVFSSERYRNSLTIQGMSPSQFEYYMRRSILLNQIRGSIELPVIITERDVTELLAIQSQQRSLQYIQLPLAAVNKDIDVSDQEILLFYTDHKQDYMNPERVQLAYIELDVNKLIKQVEIPGEDEVLTLYEEQSDSFVKPEQRQARHILMQVSSDAGDEALASARKKAQSVLERINQGEDFAVLAKEFSDDPGSAQQGGDLGLFEKGLMEASFDDVVFSLKEGDVSDLVQTTFGFHIIQLTAIQEEKVKPLAEVRDEIIRNYRTDKAGKLFVDQSDLLANLSYESPDNLEVAAEALGLTVINTDWITRQGDGQGISGNPEVLTAAFSHDVLDLSNNSEVVELSPDHVVVLRVLQHEAASVKPLDQVREDISVAIHNSKAGKALRARGEALLARVREGETLAVLAQELDLELKKSSVINRTDSTYDRAIIQAAFQMSVDENSAALVDGVVLSAGDYALVQLLDVEEGDALTLDDPARKGFRQKLEQLYANSEYESFMKGLRDKADVNLNLGKL